MAQILFEKCWSLEGCVEYPCPTFTDPFRMCDHCEGIEACVRIFTRGAGIYIEAEVLGHSEEWGLAVDEFEFSYGIGTVIIRVTDVTINRNQLVSAKLEVELCVRFEFASITFKECKVVFKKTISFLRTPVNVAVGISVEEAAAIQGLNQVISERGVVALYSGIKESCTCTCNDE